MVEIQCEHREVYRRFPNGGGFVGSCVACSSIVVVLFPTEYTLVRKDAAGNGVNGNGFNGHNVNGHVSGNGIRYKSDIEIYRKTD